MNRRAFLGSGLMSLLVGVFALLMGGIPGQSERLRRRGPLAGAVSEGDNTLAFGHLKAVRLEGPVNTLGTQIQEADYCGPIHHYRLGQQGDILPALSRIPTNEEASEIAATLAALNGRAVSWDTPPKPTPLADMRRIHTPGRQFGLG